MAVSVVDRLILATVTASTTVMALWQVELAIHAGRVNFVSEGVALFGFMHGVFLMAVSAALYALPDGGGKGTLGAVREYMYIFDPAMNFGTVAGTVLTAWATSFTLFLLATYIPRGGVHGDSTLPARMSILSQVRQLAYISTLVTSLSIMLR